MKKKLSLQKNFLEKRVKVSEEFLVLGVGCYVYMFDIFSGEAKWSFHASSPIIEIMLVPNEKAILINNELNIIKLNSYGKEIWKSSFRYDAIVEFRISEDKVVIKEFGKVNSYSLNLETGKLL